MTSIVIIKVKVKNKYFIRKNRLIGKELMCSKQKNKQTNEQITNIQKNKMKIELWCICNCDFWKATLVKVKWQWEIGTVCEECHNGN